MIQVVDFDALPGFFSPLFRRWLGEPSGTEGRHGVVRRPEDVPEPGKAVSLDVRAELCDRLAAYQRELGAAPEALASIAKLRDPRSCAVLTGQQPNLFGGPLLVVYKAATAIALARRLEMRWARPVVPVFWNHSDDADVDEIRRAYAIDRENRLCTIEAPPVPARTPIGAVDWSTDLPRVWAEFSATLPDSVSAAQVRAWFEPAGCAGPAPWFGRILARVLGPHGLVVFEPRLGRSLWADVIERGVLRLAEIRDVLAGEAARLRAEGHEPPLEHDPAVVFRVTDRQRLRLRLEGGGVKDEGGEGARSAAEEARRVRERPDEYSPGVALRPLCQDRVFPTVAYVGGPAEISYLTQARGVYAALGMKPPALVPRFSATLIEPKIRRVLEKFSLAPAESLELGRRIEALIHASLPDTTAAEFHAVRHSLVLELRRVRRLSLAVDRSLERHYRRFAGKVLRGLREVEHRTASALLEQQQIGRSQIEKAALHLAPRHLLQERSLTLAPYLCLFGPGLVERILEMAGGFESGHVLVDL